ncbi:fumarylacetoacetate hydrolase family protein [Leisingera aquaemixtae]|uniref:fumarylacetoacetate hydrolase family protein n=1 Tax=Leisingera aquaemixtae TaxID=1396826 RepID=UPI001C966D6E|nr:fumarylacetoacetate hydrolase family protein [Leisingera aquaemixtae]MBY6067426.1 fumarylacetoacetate hydrolase family protein [Leisingera aquaemixtae]
MKLLRYRTGTEVRPGMLDSAGAVRDLSAHVPDITGAVLGDETLARLSALDPKTLPLAAGAPSFAPCVGQPGKFLGIGLNYTDHAEEMGMALPEHPILFLKATSSICGPDDDVVLPRGSVSSDWEVELGVIIGKAAKYVSEAEALDYVAGYCVINDVSERDFQTKLTGQWTKGKSCDTFGPLGPWLVTRDEVPDPQNLWLTCDVNGARRQTGNTSRMVFTVAQIVSHLSQLMTLHPGDVIATGTPPGVGMGAKPEPVYLKSGDVMRLEIEGLGVQTQRVRADEE